MHESRLTLRWTGNSGTGTSSYAAYSRDHVVSAPGKAVDLPGSSAPAFRGDPARWNPEELLLASLSACHQLWYLHLCADAGVTVVAYTDEASATLQLEPDGSGRISAAVLHPQVTVTRASDADRARALHAEAAQRCFVARSVSFPVTHTPTIEVVAPGTDAA